MGLKRQGLLSLRIDDRACLGLIRKWLKAGILDTHGQVLHPVTGTPQGGIGSSVLANVHRHYALDRWFSRVVRPRCRGQAYCCRFADDCVACFQAYNCNQYKHALAAVSWPRARILKGLNPCRSAEAC